jgi:hypothetical protein
MKESQRAQIDAKLRRIRRNQRLVLVGFFSILAVGALASLVLPNNWVIGVAATVAIPWMIFTGVTQAIKCPACGKRFYSRQISKDWPISVYNYGTNKCMNCGISLVK